MEYRELVKEYIKKENGDFSEGTIKLYSIKLLQLNEQLNDNKKFDDKFEYLYNYNKVFEYIKQFKTDNAAAFLNAIISILKDNNLKKIYDEKRQYYYKEKNENRGNNTKPDNFTEYQDLLEKTAIDSFDNMSVKEALTKFMLYITVRYPIRLELYNLPIMRVKKNMDPNNNYFYITNKKMEIIMNSFKNVKSFGKTIILIDKEDEQVIKEYLKFLTENGIKQVNLIENVIKDDILPMTRSTYTRKLQLELNKLFKSKKNLTMNSIRDSYETHLMNSENYKKMTNNERQILHNRLLHSANAANANYYKI